MKYPYTNQSSYKVRPAVVISNDDFNKTNSDIVISAISSKDHHQDRDLSCTIRPKDRIVPLKGKYKDANIYCTCDKVLTIDKTIVREKISGLRPPRIQEIIGIVRSVIKNN